MPRKTELQNRVSEILEQLKQVLKYDNFSIYVKFINDNLSCKARPAINGLCLGAFKLVFGSHR